MAKAYEMEMQFSVSVGFRKINDFMAQCGFDEKLQMQDAVTVSLKQVLPTIPDFEYIQKVEDAIRETYKNDEIEATSCQFKGYKYIREITIKEDTSDG